MPLTISTTLKNCHDCRHKSHTGAFTRGGAKDCYDHPSRIGLAALDNCFKRVIRRPERIPANCPLKLGAQY